MKKKSCASLCGSHIHTHTHTHRGFFFIHHQEKRCVCWFCKCGWLREAAGWGRWDPRSVNQGLVVTLTLPVSHTQITRVPPPHVCWCVKSERAENLDKQTLALSVMAAWFNLGDSSIPPSVCRGGGNVSGIIRFTGMNFASGDHGPHRICFNHLAPRQFL